MATTIMQKGYDFVYRTTIPGQPAIVETWGIERVAAFIYLIEFHRERSQKYVKGYSLVATVGSIQYVLGEFDRLTYRDIDRLTKLLVPYSEEGVSAVFLSNFAQALDNAERILKMKVEEAERPREVAGKQYIPPRWFKRPTKEQYDEQEKEESRKIQELAGEDTRIIHVWFPDYGVLPCGILKETDATVWVDVYAGGKVVYANRRLSKKTMKAFD